MIMIFQLSDWFPKPMIWAIIVKFDQIRKNWWRISCAEILEVRKHFFAASSVKKMSRFEEVSTEEIKGIAWKFTKTVTASFVIYISSYPARPRRITVKYCLKLRYRWWLYCSSIKHLLAITLNNFWSNVMKYYEWILCPSVGLDSCDSVTLRFSFNCQ